MKTIISALMALVPINAFALYIYFPAADVPSDLAPETERCYRFEVTDLEAQRTKLENKYGNKITGSMIYEHPKGGKALEVSVNDSIKGDITLTYFTDPKVCDALHKRLEEKRNNSTVTSDEKINEEPNKQPAASSEKVKSTEKVDEEKPTTENEVVDAISFYSQYKENEVAVDRKYKGKPINLKGTVIAVQRDDAFHNKDVAIYLEYQKATSGWQKGIRAFVAPSYIEAAGDLRKGQEVFLRCIVEGNTLYSIILYDCVGKESAQSTKPPTKKEDNQSSAVNASKKSIWWSFGNDGKCKETGGPNSIMSVFKGSGVIPQTRDYKNGAGDLYKVDVLLEEDAMTNSVYTFYKFKDDCIKEKENALEEITKKY